MHQLKVEFNKTILQPKLDMQQRTKNSPKERRETKSSHLFVWAKYRQNGREKSNYLQLKKGEKKRVKIKGI